MLFLPQLDAFASVSRRLYYGTMHEEAGQTSDQVLLAVGAAGFPITGDQLARWHRAGLVPRPRQRSLGRGKGTATIYPSGTVEQVVALCQITSQHRSLARAAFKLWWDGYEVDPEQVWASLNKAAAKLDAELAGERSSKHKPANSFEGLLNRRLGPARRQQIEQAVREAVSHPEAGALVAFRDLDLPALPPPSLDDLLALALPLLVGAVSTLKAVDLVKQATYDEICDARNEMKLLFAAISRWVEPLAWLWGRKGAVFQLIADLPKAVEQVELPDLLVAALILRRVIPTEIRAVVLMPPPQLLREVAAFKAVHDQVPGADTVITPMAVRALLRHKEAANRYLPKVQDFFQTHEAEVRSVLDPQLLPAADPPSEGPEQSADKDQSSTHSPI